MKKFAVLAAVLLAATATPAIAAPIVYTISGNFTGTREGAGGFTALPAVFTAKGDTNDVRTNVLGVQGLNGIRLTSLTAFASNQTFSISTPVEFISGAGIIGLLFNNDNYNGLGFGQSGAYDGLTNLSETSFSSYYTTSGFQTDQGFVTISGVPQVTISAEVAAVPEPATWGMMILGFGVVGASMRRRKSNVRTSVRFA